MNYYKIRAFRYNLEHNRFYVWTDRNQSTLHFIDLRLPDDRIGLYDVTVGNLVLVDVDFNEEGQYKIYTGMLVDYRYVSPWEYGLMGTKIPKDHTKNMQSFSPHTVEMEAYFIG